MDFEFKPSNNLEPNLKINIFYIYSHADEELRLELEKHLAILKRQGIINEWSDRCIKPGSEWEEEIFENMEKAKLIFLLVSADFMASDYCYNIELSHALKLHRMGESIVVPIILRPVDWHTSPFGVLHVLPRNGVPVVSWKNRDEAFLDIAMGIRRLCLELRSKRVDKYDEISKKTWVKKIREDEISVVHEDRDEEPPPFDLSDFRYEIPAPRDLKTTLAPQPCIIDNHEYPNAIFELTNRIFKFYSDLEKIELQLYEETWNESKEIRLKENIKTYEEFIDRFGQHIKQKLLTKRFLLLILGETGLGKTSIGQLLSDFFDACYVDLRNFTSNIPLRDLIKETEPNQKYKMHKKFRKARVIFLDSFDKMVPGATHGETLLNFREILAETNHYHVVVIMARTHFFKSISEEQLRGFNRLKLMPITVSSALEYAEQFSLKGKLYIAIKNSESLSNMACNPLILGMLLQLIREGKDISQIETKEELFSIIVDQWLIRDSDSSRLSNQNRLYLMKRLSLHSLENGGKPFKYSTIDTVIEEKFGEINQEAKERFNTDLRVCGFIKRHDPDLFEFQHALFYEYCIARIVFEDIKEGDFSAFENHPFTDDIIDFLKNLAEKKGYADELREYIPLIWKEKISDKGRTNILKLATKMNCNRLPLDNLEFVDQNFYGVCFSSLKSGKAKFYNCDFSGSEFDNIHAINWIVYNCYIGSCQIKAVRFDSSHFESTDLFIDSPSDINFRYCTFLKCDIKISWLSRVVIHGGQLDNVQLKTIVLMDPCMTKCKPTSKIRYAKLNEIIADDNLSSFCIEDCTVDKLTLYEFSNMQLNHRPIMSRDIKSATNKWNKDASAVVDVRSPYAAVIPPHDNSFGLEKPLSKTQKRKKKRREILAEKLRSMNKK
jgi:uncharacterized protein YjbI with pentapeptide repeats